MDTTYYTFQTTKIKASGGADLVTFVPTAQPAPQDKPTADHAGEVLNFDLCRRRLETRAAWKDLTAAARNAVEVEVPQEEVQTPVETSPQTTVHPQPRKRRPRTRAPWVEILSSALALALVCLIGAAALLNFV